MRIYFKGNVNSLYVKELQINNGKIVNIIYGDILIQKDVWFYKNFMNKTIRFEDECQLADRENAEDYLISLLKGRKNRPPLSSLQVAYMDSSSLVPQPVTKQEEKEMKRQRKLQKQKIRQTRNTE